MLDWLVTQHPPLLQVKLGSAPRDFWSKINSKMQLMTRGGRDFSQNSTKQKATMTQVRK